MKKYAFISQPMKGLTPEQIKHAREKAVKYLQDRGYEVLETYFGEDFEKSTAENKALLYLGESIKYMAEARIAYFCHGWKEARGCVVEHQAAVGYGLSVVYEDEL